MYFKKIEMHGFKSFAEPVIIEFNKGITCIVGPNGSGKSNISDAVRWVLGEQSPKMLRGGKMEEVIFSGTDTRKSRGMAEVTLVIDNQQGILPIDYKEVALTRRMFRSGESEYRINGNQCRLRDIRDLIVDTGIGVDGYSIIGQGKISDILSSKPESRREIFEEAAGIVMYRGKKAESERKLAATRANMERVNDIIGELESRIGGLREESVKAREYLELRERYKKLEINITLKNIENLELKNEYIKDDLSELDMLIKDAGERKEKLEEKLGSNNEKNRELEKLSAETREKLLETIDSLNAAVNKGQIDRERLAYIDENTGRIREEISVLEQKLENEQESEREYTIKKSELDRKHAELNKALRDKIASYNETANELAAILETVDKYKSDIFEFSGEINSGKAEIGSLQKLQETLEKRYDALMAEKDAGSSTNKEMLDRLNRLKNEKSQIDEELAEIKTRAAKDRERLAEERNRHRDASSELEQLRISLGQLSARMKTIEEMEHNYEGYNHAVRYIMKSGLKGIEGVVADLIKVPKGYETAIETALGASLQNIVCSDDRSAKEAVKALKESRAGRLTFLPVSSVRGKVYRDGRLDSERGFIGFGPECIEYDLKYRDIIGYLLGRVVLVDNMDNAVRISKLVSDFRFVTLDGEVISPRGAITGGKYRNRTANILDRKAEVRTLRDRTDSIKNECAQREKNLEALKDTVRSLVDSIGKSDDLIREKEQMLLSADNEVRLAETMLQDIRSGSEKLARELESIDAEKENSRKMISDIKAKMEKDHIAVKEAEKLAEEQQTLYEGRKREADVISEEITDARISVNSCEKEKNHVDSMVERIKASVSEINLDISSRKKRLEDMAAEKESILSGGGDTDDLIREKESEKQLIEDRLEEMTRQKADLSGESLELNSEKESVDTKLAGLRNQKYELEIKNAKNETQLDTYKDRLWEDFGVSYIQAMEFKSDNFVMSVAVKENRKLKNRLKDLGEVNVGAIEEYETVKERYDFLINQREDIREAVDGLNKIIGDMDHTIRHKFKTSFDKIVVNFEEMFRELFGGGHAELRLSDEKDPLEASIDIVAQPPGKRLQNINLLSGGEKTLTAIALMFAVLKAKPTPFCILDEVEAALDDANIDRFIECLRKFDGIQFTLVTHQKATMEHADSLYGVTMPEKGVSKVLSLNLEDNFDI